MQKIVFRAQMWENGRAKLFSLETDDITIAGNIKIMYLYFYFIFYQHGTKSKAL